MLTQIKRFLFPCGAAALLLAACDSVAPNLLGQMVERIDREWVGRIDGDLVGGSQMELRLVMTKFSPPNVQIAYQLRLESGE